MDRVGGYLAYVALETDALAFDDVLIAMAGEAEASRITAAEAKHGR